MNPQTKSIKKNEAKNLSVYFLSQYWKNVHFYSVKKYIVFWGNTIFLNVNI